MRFAESSTGQPLLDHAAAERIARGLQAMADPTRVQILSLIVDAAGGVGRSLSLPMSSASPNPR